MELSTIPERDEWKYSRGYQRVCTSFVSDILKAGGVFGDLKIESTEITGRDLLDLDIW
jgi:hypothetical protein